MTHPTRPNLLDTVLQLLTTQGASSLAEGFRLLLNEAMAQERSAVLRASPYERCEARLGHANGFKPKTLNTRMGPVELRIPRVRGGIDFYPGALERGMRSEQALNLAMAEMYVQGVSTRKVSRIIEELCGHSVSSTQVSACAARLDVELQLWRERPLQACPYLIFDARYEKVRQGGVLVDCAVLIAMGVSPEGRRTILGVSAVLSEAEVHWRAFLSSLVARGLHGVGFIVSDAHPGLAAARQAVFPSVPWQRCQFHLRQNAQPLCSAPGHARRGRREHPLHLHLPGSPGRPGTAQRTRGPPYKDRSQTGRLDGGKHPAGLCRLPPAGRPPAPHAHRQRH